MNKNIAKLLDIAGRLDKRGLYEEASIADKLAQDMVFTNTQPISGTPWTSVQQKHFAVLNQIRQELGLPPGPFDREMGLKLQQLYPGAWDRSDPSQTARQLLSNIRQMKSAPSSPVNLNRREPAPTMQQIDLKPSGVSPNIDLRPKDTQYFENQGQNVQLEVGMPYFEPDSKIEVGKPYYAQNQFADDVDPDEVPPPEEWELELQNMEISPEARMKRKLERREVPMDPNEIEELLNKSILKDKMEEGYSPDMSLLKKMPGYERMEDADYYDHLPDYEANDGVKISKRQLLNIHNATLAGPNELLLKLYQIMEELDNHRIAAIGEGAGLAYGNKEKAEDAKQKAEAVEKVIRNAIKEIEEFVILWRDKGYTFNK